MNDSLVNDRCSQGKPSNARPFPAFASAMSSNMSLARTSLRAKPNVKGAESTRQTPQSHARAQLYYSIRRRSEII